MLSSFNVQILTRRAIFHTNKSAFLEQEHNILPQTKLVVLNLSFSTKEHKIDWFVVKEDALFFKENEGTIPFPAIFACICYKCLLLPGDVLKIPTLIVLIGKTSNE